MERFHSGDLIAIRAQAKRDKKAKKRQGVEVKFKLGPKTAKPIRYLFEEMARQGRSPGEFERKGLEVRRWLSESPSLDKFSAALIFLGKDWENLSENAKAGNAGKVVELEGGEADPSGHVSSDDTGHDDWGSD